MFPPDPAESSGTAAAGAGGEDPPAGRSGRGERVGYLGPQGTFSEEALLAGLAPGAAEPVAFETIHETALAVRCGDAEWAIVPIENSLDGSVTVTLDLLAGGAGELQIVGEALLAVRHSLVAAVQMPLAEIETVLTHPQVPGQCRAFLRGELPGVQVLPASSTADAVRIAAGSDPDQRVAAIGTALAAQLYGGTVLRTDIQDRDDNLTRFVWLGRRGGGRRGEEAQCGLPPLRPAPKGPWKTSLVFWGSGADRAGWLVMCLDEFARREINLTKIESRPRRRQMGQYMFFVDLEGSAADRGVAEAVAGLSTLCEEVRVLGSYPAAVAPG